MYKDGMKNYYTVQQLADELGLSRQALYLKIELGQLIVEDIAGHKLINKQEYDRWIRDYKPNMRFYNFRPDEKA